MPLPDQDILINSKPLQRGNDPVIQLPEMDRVQSPDTGSGAFSESKKALNEYLGLLAPVKPAAQSISDVRTYKPEDVTGAGRYKQFILGQDNENLNANLQSTWDKFGNAFVKMAGTAGTTFLEGTVGAVYGIGSMIYNQRGASFYDNDFNNALNNWSSKTLEDALPNYYTSREREGHWYEPANLFTANFFFDKIMKNLGFAIGAVASGGAWGSAFKAIGLAGKLVKTGQNLEQAIATMETELAATPAAIRGSKALEMLQQFGRDAGKNIIAKPLTKADRFITAGMGTLGEASIEALNNLNQYRSALIDKYTQDNGIIPTGADLDEINKSADDVGNSTFMLNTALLSVSNYIQFPRILNSTYKADKAIINSVETNAIRQGKDGIVKSVFSEKSGFGKLLSRSQKVAGLFFNPSEGVEEISQDAVQLGTQNYFNRKREGKDVAFWRDMIAGGVEQANTEQGWQDFVIGALSGGIMTSFSPFGHNTLKERGVFGQGGTKGKATAEAISALNEFSFEKTLNQRLRSVERAQIAQEKRTEAVRQGDILESKDEEYNFTHEYLISRIKYGRFDFVKQDIENARNEATTPEAFDQLKAAGKVPEGDDINTYLQRLTNLEEHATNVKSLYDSLNTRYGGLVLSLNGEPILDKNNKPVRKYSDDVIDKMVYATSKVKDYDVRIPQLSSNLLSKGINVQEIINDLSEGSTQVIPSLQTALEAINKLDVIGETKEELKQELKDVAELSLRRKSFLKEYDNIRETPNKFEQKEEKPAPVPTPVEIKTLDIDKQIMDLVSSDENYEKWSNVKNKSDLEQFKEQISFALSSLDNVKDKSKLTTETINDHLSTSKAFANKELREKVVNLLVERYATQVNKDKATELKKLQDELAKKSGTTSTGENEADQALMPREEAKKTLYALINSTTEPTSPEQRKDWMDRHQAFLAGFSKIRNRNEIQAVKITKANEAAWGLTGLIAKVNNSYLSDDKLTDKTEGIVLIVYVKKNKAGELVLIDKKGNILKAGDILNEAIYSTMGDATRTWSNGQPKYRNTEKPEIVEAAFTAYEKEREDVFSRGTKENTKAYGFVIQEGKPILDENPQAKNPVVGSIINDQKQLDNKNLVQVSTIGTISTPQGQNFQVPLGRPVLVTSSGISFLNNRNFTEEEAINITNALKQLSKDINGPNAPDIIRYLQGQFQFRTPGPTSTIGNNQLYIDELTQEIKLGETVLSSFNPDLIEINREHIQAQIQKAYNNVNNEFLTTEFEQPFNELSIDKDGKISITKWKNYQYYLLSNTLPQGGQRIGTPPLFTRVRMIEKDSVVENDFNIRRYSVLEDLEVPNVEVVKKEEKQPEKPAGNTFTLSGGETISYTIGKNGLAIPTPNASLSKAIQRVKTYTTDMDNAKAEMKAAGLNPSDDEIATDIIGNAIIVEPSVSTENKSAAIVTLQEKLAASRANAATKDKKSEYRTIGSLGARRMTKAEHEKFARWMAFNLPNIPFERVKNVIEKTNGGYAWGVFEDGMIKIFENAATGTEYHEAFEAVWNSLLSSEEQTSIINEYKLQNKNTKSSLSDQEIKEKIADKFSEYILSESPISIAGHLRKFFNDLISFFRNLINKQGATDKLFKRINTGYYSSREVNNNVDAAYNSIPDINQQVLNETIDHITASVMRDLAGNTDNFFNNFKGVNLTKLFDNAKDELNRRIDGIVTAYDDLLQENPGETKPITEAIENYYTIKENIDKNWNKIIDQEIEHLKTFNINVNEEEDVDFNDENRTGISFKRDAFKVDAKTSAPVAIKLLFATLTNNLKENLIVTNGKVLEMPNESKSETINGLQTAPFGKSFVQVLEALTGKNDIKDMMDSLVNLAKQEPNYVKLFKRLRGSIITGKIDFSSLSSNDWRLLINFYNTFTKQKPVAFIQYVGPNGAYVEAADINDVINNTVGSWIPKLRENVNKENSVIRYNSEKDQYFINKEALSSVGNHFQQLSLLKRIGIPFSLDYYNALPSDGKRDFANAVARIKNTLAGIQPSKSLTQKWLDVAGPFNTLSRLSNSLEIPELSSIFYDHNNEQRQQYVLNNYLSSFANDFNNVSSIDELLEKKKYLKDVFSVNSLVLKKGGQFFDEQGKRTDKPLRIGTILANINKQTGKSTDISKLQKGSRVMMEINNNLKGWSYNLSTSDSGTEWLIELGNPIAQASFNSEEVWSEISSVFQGYLNDEIALIQENRTNILHTESRASKLRFMDDILSPSIAGAIEAAIKTGKIDAYLSTNQSKINDEIKNYFIRKAEAMKAFLAGYNEIISPNGITFDIPSLAAQKKRFTNVELNNFLHYMMVNNTINSIELHKLYYGDPYQFKIAIDKTTGKPTLDETKRIKSGGSPKEMTFNNTEFDNAARVERNHLLTPDDIGWTAFKSYANTITIKDIKVRGSLADENSEYGNVNEADSSAWMSVPFYRQMELKRGTWTNEAEAFFQYDMARARRYFHDSPAYEYRYSSDELKEADKQLLAEKQPDYKVSVIKPLVYGPAYGKDNIQLIMDKDSVMPLTFDVSRFAGKNMTDLFYKLHFDKASDGNPRDYVIVESGRKVGADKLDELYNENGAVNQTPFTSDVRVDLDTFGYQVESAYSEKGGQTIGKQPRILATQDIYNMGVPFDSNLSREQWTALSEIEKLKASDLYTKARNYENTLNKLTEYGYNNLLNLLGIVDQGGNFKIEDYSILAETLRKEILKQAVSDNVKKAIQLNDNGQFPVAFEATNVYDKIKGIINSMMNRNLISQKVNGSPKTQVTSTLFERNNRQAVYKTKEGFKSVEDISSLSEAEKKTIILTSNELKFYTTGKDKEGKIAKVYHMEVYLPRWFANRTKMSDEELIKHLNETKEGRAVLRGIGFRIPTQKKNSIEAFIVKGFLPDSMGNTIIVPSEITKKAGSDFDFDKLNTYLKNITFDKDGIPRIVVIEELNTNSELELLKFYEEKVTRIDKIDTGNTHQLAAFYERNLLEAYKKFKSAEKDSNVEISAGKLFTDLFDEIEEKDVNTDLVNKLERIYTPSLEEFLRVAKGMNINELNREYNIRYNGDVSYEEFTEFSKGKDKYEVNQKYNHEYKKIVENEFFQATEDLMLHPAMYERLIKPNEGGGLFKTIRDNVISAVGSDSGLTYPSMIDMIYRATMRHNASSAAGGIGIVATNITLQTNLQKIGAFLNRAVISKLSKKDRQFLPNVNIALKHNTLNGVPTLSGMKDVSGNYISDGMSNLADGMVDVTKDPWVTELFGDNSNVHSTAILLTLLGVKSSSIGYFLNQPIIREYLKSLSAQGKTYILDQDLQKDMLEKFSSSFSTANKIDEGKLLANIQKYYKDKKSFTGQEKAEQRFILNEFLKYVAIASNLYGFNSAIGYDNKNRGLTSFDNRKSRTNKEKDLNIISGINDLTSNTFLGPLYESLDSTHTALAEVFPLLKKRIRDMFNSIKQSIDVRFMNGDTRAKIDEGIHRSFIDYILHTETRYFTQNIQKLLIDHSTAVSTRLLEAQDKLNNPFVKALAQIADRKDLLNIKLAKPDTDNFTSNLYIAAFRQLKQQDKQLYDDLIKLAIIQSGINRSKLSYSHLIPIEEYRLIAGDVISKLDINPDITLFQINNAFFRNNWNDRKIVANVNINKQGDITAFSKVPASIRALGVQTGTNFIQVHPDWGNKSSYPVLKTVTYTRDSNGKSIPKISLYQKVMRDVQNQTPFITEEGQFIYKQINAWGDSIYLQEYYKDPRPSQYDNNTVKIDEVADELIVNTYDKAIEKPAVLEERIDEIIDSLAAYGPADLPKLSDENTDNCS